MKNRKIIDEIMDNFDFDKVHRVMTFLNWEWYTEDNVYEVPSPYDLKRTARKLMKDVLKALDTNPQFYIGTGGFIVTGNTYEGKKYIRLGFDISTWDNYD